MKKVLLSFLLPVIISVQLSATGISVSNIILTGQNVTAGVNNVANYTMVQFNISWNNSWYDNVNLPNNWDAAWVFIKYSVAGGPWQHAWLNNTGNVAPSGSQITVGLKTPGSGFNATTNPGIGVEIYRNANGNGTFSLSGVQLQWNYGANGVLDNQDVNIQVFAIEMVYVPQGAFSAGDGNTVNNYGQFCAGTSVTTPFTISSETALTLGGSLTGNLGNNNALGMWAADDFNNTTTQTLPAAFPKGYNAFYCMKYEITQQQYVNFLNTLTRVQQATRVAAITANQYALSNTATVSYRNGIRCPSSIPPSPAPVTFICDLNGNGIGNEANDGQWIACNNLSYMDMAAYLDWCGLRPMTELEFEKSCRGPLAPAPGEYAWGNTIITQADNITGGGTSCETTGTAGANAVYNDDANVLGPMRVGLFATAASTRMQAGATYYGIMNMSDNVYENTVTVGNSTGRTFIGLQGDGALAADGNANQTAWPGLSAGEVTGALGVGYRGGMWGDGISSLRVSDRYFASFSDTSRNGDYGGRGIRIAP